ncbi:MAG TPA: aminotransferase class V-fold PLP-dependent enzyme [Acidimicrobiales bacterium]|nr:aminotransferase class V-fold PLP-dependent enzyme [Acidimicrobiales bacterium]
MPELTIDRSFAEGLDRSDSLASVRQQFEIDPAGPIYLDGHSLGRLPKRVRERLHAVIDEDWARDLVASWDEWVDWPLAVGDRLGTALLGAAPGQVAAADSTTINLFKVASAVLARQPGPLVTDRTNFPTDRYVLQGLAQAAGVEMRLIDVERDTGPQPDLIERAVEGASLVCLSSVDFRSGAVAPMLEINEVCKRAGARVLWDLSHAVGAVPVELDASGAELAVGCTYKYVNAGPGSPAFVYVRKELQAELRQPIWGWFGQREMFVMGPEYDPVEGIGQFVAGTPSILGLAALDAAVAVLADAGIRELRRKGMALVGYASDLIEARLGEFGVVLGGPRRPELRGSHVSMHHPDAYNLGDALSKEGVMGDVRPPDLLRFGLAPAYTRFVDVWDAVDKLTALLRRNG